jgi:hypothetical protein
MVVGCIAIVMGLKGQIKVVFQSMDDATYKYLIQKRIQYEKPKMDVAPFKSQILDLTSQLFDHKMSGELQTAFDTYVAECVHHLTEKKEEVVLPQLPLPADTLMYKPKKVNVFMLKSKRK